MNKLHFQNLFGPRKLVHCASCGASCVVSDANTGMLASAAGRVRAWIEEIDRKRRTEYDNARAIAHLRSLDDARLRDIGIARLDIERAVRLGRDEV